MRLTRQKRFLGAAFAAALLAAPFATAFAAAQAPAATPPAPAPAPATSSAPAPAPASSPAQSQARNTRFLILLDPAHGGDDTGARLSPDMLEKDVTLAISFRLRSLLAARGFAVISTRDNDASAPTLDDRASAANHADALACILIHATASGNGVHIFNSSLPPANVPPSSTRRFLPWDTAQSAYIDRSLRLAAEMSAALDRAKIPVTLGRTYLRPLDNLTCPAVAVEMAPLAASDGQDAADVSNPAYQQRVADAIAWALMQWRMHTTGIQSTGPASSQTSSQTSNQTGGAL